MRTRKGSLQRTATGFRARFRINGKNVYRRLNAVDEAAAGAEMRGLAEYLAGTTSDVVADGLRALAARIERDDGGNDLPIGQVWGVFESSRKRRPCCASTLEMYRSQVDAFVAWAGTMPLRGVTPVVAERYAAYLDAQDIRGSTANKHLAALKMVWGVVAPTSGNPWNGLRSHRSEVATKREDFTVDQLRVILNAPANPDITDILYVLTYTGLRLGDAIAIRVENIDLSRRVISVLPQKTGRRGKAPMRAMIGIHHAVEPTLRKRIAGRVSGLLFPDLRSAYQRDRASVAKRIAAHLESVGFACRVDAEHGRASCVYGAHSFRHTLQTLLVRAGVHPYIANAIICHKVAGDLGQHYFHVSPDMVIEAIEKALPDLRQDMGKVIKMEGAA